jgi:GTP-binding protein
VFSISALARDGLQPLMESIYTHVAKDQRVDALPDQRFDPPPAAQDG